MKSLVVLAFSIGIFNSAFSDFQERIFNGKDAEIEDFPYMANFAALKVRCGGALISERFVLTAAHCLRHLNKGDIIEVTLGETYKYPSILTEHGREIVGKLNFWLHEKFEMPSAINDIGLIELPEAVNVTKWIKPIKISKEPSVDQVHANQLVTISGWGKIDYNTNPSVLQTASLQLIPIKDCMEFQSHFVESVTEKHICTKGLKINGTEPPSGCDGDSGTPLVLASSGELIGVTSFVKDAEDGVATSNICTSSTAPNVYTRVASYLDWISEKTGIQFD